MEEKHKSPSKPDYKDPGKSYDEKIPTNEMPNYIKENPADMPEINQEPERNRLKTMRASENNQIDTEQH